MRSFWKYLFPALFGLVIYLSIRIVNDTMSEQQFWHRSIKQNSIEILFTVAIAYLQHYMLSYFIDRFSKQRDSLLINNALQEFSIIAIASILIINPALFLIHYLANDPIDIADVAIANIIILLYVLLYYAIVRGNNLVRSYVEQQTQLERLKSEGLQTELKFLKAQYHPHFLFNALNTIYFQMDESIPAAKKTVEKFSELLRYQLYDQQQLVSFEQEWRHLENFIHLQKSRASEKLQLKIKLDESLNSKKLYPLLLLPFVENAFKYTGGDYMIIIEATREEEMLHFKVVNSVPVCQQLEGGGIGLDNLKRRLELLYGEKLFFSAILMEDTFIAELKLPLH